MNAMKKKRFIILVLIFSVTLAVSGCEGPEGPVGPQGDQGVEGLAGADGSMVYAGQGEPDPDLGNPGDFYLDLASGNLYGPKTGDGWETSMSLRGPDGPQGPPGMDGSANVSRFIVSSNGNGYDFSNFNSLTINGAFYNATDASIPLIFLVYLVQKDPENTDLIQGAYQIPGYGRLGNTFYNLRISQFEPVNNPPRYNMHITKISGPGEFYDEIHIIRIEIENAAGKIKASQSGSVFTEPVYPLILKDPDVLNYHKVLESFQITDAETE